MYLFNIATFYCSCRSIVNFCKDRLHLAINFYMHHYILAKENLCMKDPRLADEHATAFLSEMVRNYIRLNGGF